MKLADFPLLLSGWASVCRHITAAAVFADGAAFVLERMAAELMGLSLVARYHLVPKG